MFIIERQSTNVFVKPDGTSQVFFASTIRPAIVGPEFSQWERKVAGERRG